MLVDYDYLMEEEKLNAVVQAMGYDNWKELSQQLIDSNIGKNSSIEKLYKDFLQTKCRICLRNKNKVNRKSESWNYSYFYIQDCLCEDCPVHKTTCLKEKAEQLYTALPVFIISDGQENKINPYKIQLSSIDFKQLQEKQQKLYDEISKNLGISSLTIEI